MTVRTTLAALALALPPAFASAFDIEAALDLGQQVALSTCEAANLAADAESVRILERDYLNLARAATRLGIEHQPELVVARCKIATPAQVLGGKVVVHPDIAQWDDGARQFVIAHEIGHIVRGDWATFKSHLAKEIPPETPDERVQEALGAATRGAMRLAHGFEFGADTFAMALLAQIGRQPQEALSDGQSALRHGPPTKATVTHPGTFERIARLASHTH